MGDAKGKKIMKKTPKLGRRMRNSFDELKPSVTGKTLRIRLFSSSNNDSSNALNSTSKLSRALGGSKMFRSPSFASRGLTGKSIASQHGCSKYVDDKSIMSILRPTKADSFLLPIQVSQSCRRRTTKQKMARRMVELNDGLVTMTLADQHTPGKGTKEYFHVYNMCGLNIEKESKVVQIQAFPGKKTKEMHEKKLDSLTTYTWVLATEAQTEYIATTMMIEAESYATAIDVHLGYLEKTGKEVSPEHHECLLRKRVDLFLISKSEESNCVNFAIDQLASYLREKGMENESKFWEGEIGLKASKRTAFKSPMIPLQEKRLGELKDTKFSSISEILGSFLDIKEANEANKSCSSYYMRLKDEGNLHTAD